MTDKEIKQREAQMAQLMVLQARVMYQQTIITNGLYKTRKIYHGTRLVRFIMELKNSRTSRKSINRRRIAQE